MPVPLSANYPPQLSMQAVWASSIKHSFNPTNMTWSGGTVTVTAPDHQLTNSDTISITSTNGSSPWVAASVTATVVDINTFTYPLVSNPVVTFVPADPSSFSMVVNNGGTYTSVELITISCATYSKLMFRPTVVQVEALPGSTTIKLQGKVHPDASWVDIQTVADTDGLTQVVFNTIYDMVRGKRTVGSGQPVLYAQF